ncbi:MAG: magnesium transporter [Candidatus Ranarchaeia archaeon]
MSVRGAIGGAFCGRITTGLHIGLVKPSFSGNTKYYYSIKNAVIVLSFISACLISSVSLFIGTILGYIRFNDVIPAIVIIFSTIGISMLLIPSVTTLIAFLAYKRGLNPDVIVYPAISTIADVTITLIFSFILLLSTLGLQGFFFLVIISTVFFFVNIRLVKTSLEYSEFVKMIKEFLIALTIVVIIVNVSGAIFKQIYEAVKQRPEYLIVYPAAIDTLGDVGAVVGSSLSTDLATGTAKPDKKIFRTESTTVLVTWSAALIMFGVYYVITLILQPSLLTTEPAQFGLRLLKIYLLSSLIVILLSFTIGVQSYQRNLNPDNFIIPVETSLIDAVTTLIIYLVILI